jgi:hypothetical protein
MDIFEEVMTMAFGQNRCSRVRPVALPQATMNMAVGQESLELISFPLTAGYRLRL